MPAHFFEIVKLNPMKIMGLNLIPTKSRTLYDLGCHIYSGRKNCISQSNEPCSAYFLIKYLRKFPIIAIMASKDKIRLRWGRLPPLKILYCGRCFEGNEKGTKTLIWNYFANKKKKYSDLRKPLCIYFAGCLTHHFIFNEPATT